MQKQFLARWRSSNMSASQVTTRLLKVTSKELRHVAVEHAKTISETRNCKRFSLRAQILVVPVSPSEMAWYQRVPWCKDFRNIVLRIAISPYYGSM